MRLYTTEVLDENSNELLAVLNWTCDDPNMFYDAAPSRFSDAKRLRKEATGAERVLWARLSRNRLGARFRRQHPIGSFVADFYCHAAKLVIEVDGEIHETIRQKRLDQQRASELESLGLKVLRFTNDDVYTNTDDVIKEIKKHMSAELLPKIQVPCTTFSPSGESKTRHVKQKNNLLNETISKTKKA